MKTAFKVFGDPRLAREAITALRSGGYSAEAIGVLVRKDGEAATVLEEPLMEIGTLPEIGPVSVLGADAMGLGDLPPGGDASSALAASLGLSEEALSTFSLTLLSGGVLIAVRTGDEDLAKARKIMRGVEPANMRIPKEPNVAFELADRCTATYQSDKAR